MSLIFVELITWNVGIFLSNSSILEKAWKDPAFSMLNFKNKIIHCTNSKLNKNDW